MSFPKYPSYIDSQQKWLAEVPGHWALKRLSHYFDERRERASDTEFQPLSVTKAGIVPQLETAAKTQDGDNRKKVLKGDFVINSRSDRKGSAGIAPFDGSVSLICTVMTPKGLDGEFVHHLLRSELFQEEYYRWGKGIVSDLWSTSFSEMKNIVIGVPPGAEQTQIARFLDHETAKIDALIAEQQRLIELLKEKRQAVISHAVTKGLDPNVPMKDSGVEWLGEVPAHWKVVPFRFAIEYQEGPGIMAADFHDEGTPLLRISGVQSRWATLDGCNYLDPNKVMEKWGHFRLNVGDLVISGSASMGTVAEVGQETAGAIPYTGLIRLKERKGISDKCFIRAVVSSAQFFVQIDLLKAGSTIQHFGPTHLSQMKIAFPPLNEQQMIAKYIETATATFDELLGEAEGLTNILQERRSALISAAVTGKIDVRNWQPPANESAFDDEVRQAGLETPA